MTALGAKRVRSNGVPSGRGREGERSSHSRRELPSDLGTAANRLDL